MDDGYDYRITDHIMEDAFQANKRKNEERQTRIYILYIELPGAGGYTKRFSDYNRAKDEAMSTIEHYPDAYVEVSLRGELLLFSGASETL